MLCNHDSWHYGSTVPGTIHKVVVVSQTFGFRKWLIRVPMNMWGLLVAQVTIGPGVTGGQLATFMDAKER